MSFTHLHVTTTFSPGHGTAAPADLAAAAAMQGTTALACTDHDGLYGAVDHVVACRAHGLAPLLGVNLAVLEPDGGRARGRSSGRVVVLAHGGGGGYRALCRLVADAHVHTAGRAGAAVPPGVTRQELAARAVDPGSGTPLLTVLLGPESDVGLAMQGPRYLRPRTLFKEWLAAMPTGTVAAEVVSHHTGPGSTFTTGQFTMAHFSTAHAARMLKLAREHHIPAILSNAVRHLSAPAPAPQESPLQQGLASRPASPRLALAPAGRDLRQPAGTQAFLKNISEMEQTARGICHAADLRVKDLEQLLEDTHRLAETCRLDPATDLGWGTALLPEATVLGLTMAPQAELAERCQTALDRSASGLSAAEGLDLRERVARELAVIETRGGASFYLAAADVTETLRGLGIRVSGRSWTTASVVAHLLGISSVNPLSLPTESGSSPSASAAAADAGPAPEGAAALEGTTPDVFPPLELDLEAGGLREVHRALTRRFGKDRVCLLGSAPAADPGPEASPLLEGAETLVEVSDPSGTLPGGLSRRSSGVLLGDASLLHRIPTQPGTAGLPLSQYAPEDLGHWGFLRVTLRESSAQTVIARTLRRIHGQEVTADLDPGEAEPSEEALALLESEQGLFALTDPADVLAARHVTWLRSHHPAEFIAACWDSPAGSVPQNVLRAEARKLGIPVLPLDVNRSAEECEAEDHRETPAGAAGTHERARTPERFRAHETPGTPEWSRAHEKTGTQESSGAPASSRDLGLRPGLRDVPGLSAAERKRLIAGRPYHSVEELLTRAAVSRATVKKLAEAGALDALCGPAGGQEARAALIRNLQELAHRPSGVPLAGVRGQLTLPLGDGLEVHDAEGLLPGSPAEDAPGTASATDAGADMDSEAPDSEAEAETPGGAASEPTVTPAHRQLSRVRTPAPSEFPPPTSRTPDPVRRTGSG